MFVCLSPGGQSQTQGEVAKDKLLVGTVDGIFAFQKRGGSWESQGTMVPGKHFSSIIFEPTTKTLLGGTYSCEINASTDLGPIRPLGIGRRRVRDICVSMSLSRYMLTAFAPPAMR